ncbi:MAG: phospholipase D-like domain-containing protein [Acidobacteriaceae bacterium]|nr:phospholipase D-like domain-containing protein [Acidobacteriaceae bacterium]
MKRKPFRTALLSSFVALLSVVSAKAQTIYTFPDDGFTPVYTYINSATKTLDMTMYELVDTTAVNDLIALEAKGVVVRVILDQNLEKTKNTPAYNTLTAAGISVHWANTTYHATHQKTIIVDKASALILSANLTSEYYSDTRDFGVLDTNSSNVSAIEATFNKDFTDTAWTPSKAYSLIWSPTDSDADLLAIINNAEYTLTVESEEISASDIVKALEAAAARGVVVKLIMTNDDNDYASEFNALAAAGVNVHVFKDNSSTLYIHAKVTIADAGYSGDQKVFCGSENYSTASLKENRELGIVMATSALVTKFNGVLLTDYANSTVWVPTA